MDGGQDGKLTTPSSHRRDCSYKLMRTVLITGTSTGFGRAVAVELAKRGWRVFATMRNVDKKEPLERALSEAGVLNQVEIKQLDVTLSASVKAAVKSTLTQTGGTLDAVVHNAGVAAVGPSKICPMRSYAMSWR